MRRTEHDDYDGSLDNRDTNEKKSLSRCSSDSEDVSGVAVDSKTSEVDPGSQHDGSNPPTIIGTADLDCPAPLDHESEERQLPPIVGERDHRNSRNYRKITLV